MQLCVGSQNTYQNDKSLQEIKLCVQSDYYSRLNSQHKASKPKGGGGGGLYDHSICTRIVTSILEIIFIQAFKTASKVASTLTQYCYTSDSNCSPKLDHIFIRLGPAPPMPPSLLGLPARTCAGRLPRWAPM